MTQVAFGVFDWIDRGKAPLRQLYEERLQLLEVADAAGFFLDHRLEGLFPVLVSVSAALLAPRETRTA